MTTTVKIKEVKVTSEGTDPKVDRRTYSGHVIFTLTGSLGQIEVQSPFHDVQSMDFAAGEALTELKNFLKSAQRAVDQAAAEYGYVRR